MKVGELIEELRKLPPNLDVVCECADAANAGMGFGAAGVNELFDTLEASVTDVFLRRQCVVIDAAVGWGEP